MEALTPEKALEMLNQIARAQNLPAQAHEEIKEAHAVLMEAIKKE